MKYNIPVSELLQSECNNMLSTDTFAIDCSTKLIIYANSQLKNFNVSSFIGKHCYEAFKCRDSICDNCNAFINSADDKLSTNICINEFNANTFASVSKMKNICENDILLITVSHAEKINEYHTHLKQLAFFDTSLAVKNITVFFETIHYLINFKKSTGYIIALDFYNIKLILSTYGKEYCNNFLSTFVNDLKELDYCNDIYRYSHKDLVIILENYERNEVIRLLNLIYSRFSNILLHYNTEVKLSLSAGFMSFPNYANNHSDLIINLDYLIAYCDKLTNNSYIEFNDTVLAEVSRKNKIIKILNDAVKNNSFEVYFQPIYDVEKKMYNKAEALVRLNNTELGNISPAEFIPIAEEIGLIAKIGKFVLDSACKKIRELLDKNYIIECINVNASPIELNSYGYCDYVIGLINKYNIPSGMLEIEVTEGVFVDSFENSNKVFKKLMSKGVVFALDDFGTGYSGLSYLINMPVNTIKLDRSFISQITNTVNNVIVEGIISIAKKLNLSVIAEGVETKNQLDILTRYGCESIQGFYFSKPVPYGDINASFLLQR